MLKEDKNTENLVGYVLNSNTFWSLCNAIYRGHILYVLNVRVIINHNARCVIPDQSHCGYLLSL